MKDKIAIMIPTYQHRYDEIINYVNDLNDDRFDNFIILSKNDPKLESYNDTFNWSNNTHVLVFDVNTIGAKRKMALDYLWNNEYRYVIQIEDDIKKTAGKITPDSKRSTSNSYRIVKIPFIELMEKMIDVMKEREAAYVSPSYSFTLGFSVPGNISINKSINFGQVNMFDLKQLYANDITFKTEENIHEDIELIIEILQHGLTAITIKDYGFYNIPESTKKDNSLLCNNGKEDIMRMNLYIHHRDYIKLVVNNKDELKLRCNISKFLNNNKPYIIDDEYHNKLYELCKKYDTEGVKNLIKNSK